MGKKEKPSKKAGSPAKPAKTAHELAAQAGANPEVAAALVGCLLLPKIELLRVSLP